MRFFRDRARMLPWHASIQTPPCQWMGAMSVDINMSVEPSTSCTVHVLSMRTINPGPSDFDSKQSNLHGIRGQLAVCERMMGRRRCNHNSHLVWRTWLIERRKTCLSEHGMVKSQNWPARTCGWRGAPMVCWSCSIVSRVWFQCYRGWHGDIQCMLEDRKTWWRKDQTAWSLQCCYWDEQHRPLLTSGHHVR